MLIIDIFMILYYPVTADNYRNVYMHSN